MSARPSVLENGPKSGKLLLNMMLEQKPAVETLSQYTLDALYQADLANDELLCIGKMVAKQLKCCSDLIEEFRFESESDACATSITERVSSICSSYALLSSLNRSMLDKIYSVRNFLGMAQRDLAPATAFTGLQAGLATRLDMAFAELRAAESAIATVEARTQIDVEMLTRIGR